jgi:hypothetical protein
MMVAVFLFVCDQQLGSRMKKRLYVEFINEYGAAESGVDAGGLFKVWS